MKNRLTTIPEEVINLTRTKLSKEGIELTFEEVDKRIRQAIDTVRNTMESQGFPFPKDDYQAVKLMKLVMMGE